MHVRRATTDDRVGIRNVLDAGLLEIDTTVFRAAIPDGRVLVAVESRVDEEESPILGALVVDDDEIDAVAVRPGRRGQGVGTRLVETALDRHGHLAVAFDERVRPFWESLDVSIDSVDGDRYRGTLRIDTG
jgi:GNAT superfamily N-acetyltransferase